MSADVRAALATAADSVLGADRCSAYYRQTARPGDAWVSWSRMDRDSTGFGFMESYEVRVVLPQDLGAAEAWADENTAALVEALSADLTITAAAMVTLVMDAGNIPGLVVTGVRPN